MTFLPNHAQSRDPRIIDERLLELRSKEVIPHADQAMPGWPGIGRGLRGFLGRRGPGLFVYFKHAEAGGFCD